MPTAVYKRGQIVIPAEGRREDSIEAGDRFEIERVRAGECLLRRIAEAPNKGLTDWLPPNLHTQPRHGPPTKVAPHAVVYD